MIPRSLGESKQVREDENSRRFWDLIPFGRFFQVQFSRRFDYLFVNFEFCADDELALERIRFGLGFRLISFLIQLISGSICVIC